MQNLPGHLSTETTVMMWLSLRMKYSLDIPKRMRQLSSASLMPVLELT